jgi:hypothetical protein
MTHHIDFVHWAKSKKERDSAYGRLRKFTDWAESPEGKGFEHRFTFGQHKGQTFADVARHDPGYHVRYMRILTRNKESPHDELVEYIRWLESTTSGEQGSTVPLPTAGDGAGNAPSTSLSASADARPDYYATIPAECGSSESSSAGPIAPSELPPRDELEAYIDWLDNGQRRFTFGRHKGQTFREVADKDPSYPS